MQANNYDIFRCEKFTQKVVKLDVFCLKIFATLCPQNAWQIKIKLEKAAQGVAQCEVSATRVVVDAALRRIAKSRHGGHKIANISRDCERI